MRLRFMVSKAINMLSAMNVSVQFPILELPNELIAYIVEHIDSRATLQRLACTCHRMQQLTEPILYRSVTIPDCNKAERILDALNARGERRVAVKTLSFPLSANASQHAVRCVYGPYEALLNRAIDIRELMVESPFCNSAKFEDPDQWRRMSDHIFAPFQPMSIPANETRLSEMPLHKLRKLTLHMNGAESPYWDIDTRSIHLFLHPTLQWMKLSCVNIINVLSEHEGHETRTPLRHLILEECNISRSGLSRILSLPKALETLYLGENVHNIRHFPQAVHPSYNHLFEKHPEATIAALALQKDSLKELTYVTTETYYQLHQFAQGLSYQSSSHVDGSFADFGCLEKIALFGQCPNFERAVMTLRSPVNLWKLCLKAADPFRARDTDSHPAQDDSDQMQRHIPFLRAPSSSIPTTLKHLDLIFDRFMRADNAKRELVTAAAKKAHQAGIEMRVLYQEHSRFIPPYLSGEQEPKDDIVYCNGGFVGKFAGSSQVVGEEDTDHEDDDDSGSEWVYDED